ncbi:DedA family protein [Leptospira wolffii]|uniref:SNARE-like domain protein n=1 Tax=Leptospira wolffii TaxID=409998 RepID=A0A2M9ZCC3_9LEPT|nr:VTT domain-containing protein [Leptospira wolffii]PJZ66039.1 SNARE-like domain protein [Leptospira wolffii]TGK59232.1 DedA family protein [Leptospira wolffii]TGK71387.1 DedA family protein [Leptospira wolffii]TGK75918.1 DedA family protein [Leptospira wolffii]TGL29336.1 DedA family protein [Leptospira wolffii]
MEISDLLSDAITHYGGPGLAFVSFSAATLLPFSSEAALMVAIWSGIGKTDAILWASLGNCSACAFNYGLGYWFGKGVEKKITQSKTYSLWADRMGSWGHWALLLSFLPFIGDPITVLSGFFRQKLWIFVPLVFSLRILRYIALAYGIAF